MKFLPPTLVIALAASLAQAAPIDTLLAVGPEGEGNAEAAAAWQELTAKADVATLLALLEAMDDASPIASNWLRSAAEVIAGKLPDNGREVVRPLRDFLADKTHDPRARRFAFELLRKADPKLADVLVPSMIDDPSPELRREAVARLIDEAAGHADGDRKREAVAIYQRALRSAVEEHQIKPIAEALKELGTEVDLPKHFGFLMRWQVAGPFDNTGRNGFSRAYPLEAGQLDLGASYKGSDGQVKWQPLASSDPFGKIDLNKPYGMLKERLSYAYTEVEMPAAREAELRLGTKNAFKIWLNGELVFARDEYHRGQRIDQYRLPVKLREGKNAILVKLCQNEQKEEWTVQWEFQLRICDSTGAAILASDRQPTPKPDPKRPPRRPKKP